MDIPAEYYGTAQPSRTQHSDERSVDTDIAHLSNNDGPIVTMAPIKRFQLGYFDVVCLVVNFMIGTGVFQSQTRVVQGTDSTGAALLLWFIGIVYCLCGMHVYIELGLNIPRYTIKGVEQSVPRSGGDLNYLQYAYPRPAYRKNTIMLSSCLFGAGFIAFGNMAGNAINFAVRLLRAAGIEDPNNGAVRGIAIAVATLTCFIHAFSRRGGIYLNNIFAVVKISMLLLIICTAIVVGAGGLKHTKNVITENTKTSNAFDAEKTDANGYAHAFLAVIFSFWGFEQPNYIMGEISNPKKRFPRSMTIGVAIVCVLYMAVQISYMVVVPKAVQMDPASGGTAQAFFELSLGSIGPGNVGHRIFNAFLAVSSVGNMIVMTYTMARVKQEIAKEGILPFPKFFAQNRDLSLGRVLHWLRKKGYFLRLLEHEWLLPEHHSEKTPVGAFVLHFFSCLILIFATWGMTPDSAYDLLTTLSVYVINCFYGFFVGLSVLVLRFKGPPPTQDVDEQSERPLSRKTWSEMTGPKINPAVSVFTASFFMICNAWPVITTWIKPTRVTADGLPWWLIPSIAWAIIVLGVAWFLGFLTVANFVEKRRHQAFVVEKKPEFEEADEDANQGLVLVHETTYLSWVGKETFARPEEHFTSHGEQHAAKSSLAITHTDDTYYPSMQHGSPLSGFDGHHQVAQFPQFPQRSHFQPQTPPLQRPDYQWTGSHYAIYEEQDHGFHQEPYRGQSFSQSPTQPSRGYTGNSFRF